MIFGKPTQFKIKKGIKINGGPHENKNSGTGNDIV